MIHEQAPRGLSRKALFWRIARLRFGTPRVGVLTLRASIAGALAQAAGKRWPEA